MKHQNRAKVLIIPSWYPTERRPIEGSFFQEQAMAMKHLFDIKIFYPERIGANRLGKLFNTLFCLLKIKPVTEFIEDNFANDPEKLLFQYKSGISWLKMEGRLLEWQCNAAFEKMIKTGWKPDLIHAQCTTFGGIISYFLSKRNKIPYIISEHNVFLLHMYSKETQGLMKSALENAKIVHAVSEHQKRMIMMSNVNCNPIVLGNMVDEDIFGIVAKQTKVFTILYISSDHYIKDNSTFFKSIKMFQQKSKDSFKVKLLGRSLGTGETSQFYILAKEYGLIDNIEIIEHVERDKIVNYFHDSDVLVSSSIAETFGISMCEAMFCGIPIISTANGGVDDMINDKNGIKVNIGDEAAICDALLRICRKEIIFNQQEIRDSVIYKFSKKVFVEKFDEIYSSAINGSIKS